MDAILQFIPILIVGFATSLGLTPLTRQLAMRFGVVDKPNQPRKTHKDHKPMMGGLAICLGLTISVLLFSPRQHYSELIVILVGAALLAFIGLLDDRYNLSWRLRFGVQFLAALLLVLSGIQIRLFGTPLIDIPVTLIWVVALTNATNFLDNMDGLASGLSSIAAAWFLLIALIQDQVLVSLLAAAILGSAVGFLTYNFAPSSTFMGDMGALPLGFLLATLAIKLNFASQPLSVTWMIPLFVLVLPVFDINLVVWTRLSEGRSPTEAGRDHISHRIQSLGFNARQTLFLLYLLCTVFGAIGLLISLAPAELGMRVGIVGLLTIAFLAVIMIWIRQKYQKKTA
jgi:UDP-GlcNAc:undecaprenyl-phosphate/decaprenyl-phosphate GlcNAc-1-phosphate transferase